MTTDDLDLDAPASEDYPGDCARGLRKYLFVMAVIVVGTLAGTFWYRSLGPGAGLAGSGSELAGLPAGGFGAVAPAAAGGRTRPLPGPCALPWDRDLPCRGHRPTGPKRPQAA